MFLFLNLLVSNVKICNKIGKKVKNYSEFFFKGVIVNQLKIFSLSLSLRFRYLDIFK